jgi:LuxR family transcriptional regulator, quorum-sensing system regulator LasR
MTNKLSRASIPPSVFTDRKQKEMYEEARRHGVCTGVSLPVHGPKQEVGVLSFVCGDQSRRELNNQVKRHLPILALLRDVAFDTAQRFLVGHTETLVPRLTPREHECLKWTAQAEGAVSTSTSLSMERASIIDIYFTSFRTRYANHPKCRRVFVPILLDSFASQANCIWFMRIR